MKSLLVFPALLLAVFSSADDWPNWRGPNFDGISNETIPEILPEELPVLWKAKVGIGFSTVSVKGDRVLTMGNDGKGTDTVRCLSAKTGDVIWRHDYKCPLDPLYYEGGPSATPTIHGDSVYTLSKKGHAFRLDLETGEVIWERDLVADHKFELPEWSFASSAFIEGDRVLLNVGRGGVALHRESGKTVWVNSSETSGYATVVPFPNRDAHLLFSALSLFAFDADTGKMHWEYKSKSSRNVNAADPI
ncbi:MAG: PQQ-binding-like beta-propeller repeat protein, partial [Verrucomicrobiales bacterium]|nr:PQQ-binding-like beta-propeller repeat protein [Verrucomicrobiales bacterium]